MGVPVQRILIRVLLYWGGVTQLWYPYCGQSVYGSSPARTWLSLNADPRKAESGGCDLTILITCSPWRMSDTPRMATICVLQNIQLLNIGFLIPWISKIYVHFLLWCVEIYNMKYTYIICCTLYSFSFLPEGKLSIEFHTFNSANLGIHQL